MGKETGSGGGLLVGATDKNGGEGIQVIAPEGNIRMGGGEMVVVSDASKSTEKHEFDGKEMTPCEVVSEINHRNGGVKIPCDIAEPANTTDSKMATGDVIKMDRGGKVNDIELTEMMWLLKNEGSQTFDNPQNISIADKLVKSGLADKTGGVYGLTKKGEMRLMENGGAIESEEPSTAIIKVLKSNPLYSEKTLSFDNLSKIINSVIVDYLKYDKNNPITTKFNESIYFEPSSAHTAREGSNKAKIEYATHFVTGSIMDGRVKKRAFDKSKWDALQFLIPVLKSPDVQRLYQKEDIRSNRQAAIIYAKEIMVQDGLCVILVAEINKDHVVRAITFIPKNKCGYIEKQKASNVWSDASVIVPLSNEKPPFDRDQTKAVGGNISRSSNDKDIKENDTNTIYFYGSNNQTVGSLNANKFNENELIAIYKAMQPQSLELANKLNNTPISNNPTMSYYEQLSQCQHDKLGDKSLGVGTAITDNQSGTVSNIVSIEHRGFKLLPQSSFSGFQKQEFFVPFEEFMKNFEESKINVGGYEHTDPDTKLMLLAIKDIIACNIIKEQSGDLAELENEVEKEVELDEAMKKGGIVKSVKVNRRGVVKEIKGSDGRTIKEVHVGDKSYRRNGAKKHYACGDQVLTQEEVSAISMNYGGIVGVEEMPNYYRVDISSPRNVHTCRTPKWATNVANSVKKGSKVVTCRKYKKWFPSSVLVPKNVDSDKAKEIAKEIRDKIEHKNMENGGVLETGATSPKVNNLSLFADSTPILVEMRDAIYNVISNRIARGFDMEMDQIKNKFTKFLLSTAGQYVREMGGTKEAKEEATLEPKEKDEFKTLYADRLPDWLKDNEIVKNIPPKVMEYVGKLFGVSMDKGGEVDSITEENYETIKSIKFWDYLNSKKRLHFLLDHTDQVLGKPVAELSETELEEYKSNASKSWDKLPEDVKAVIEDHVVSGLYEVADEASLENYVSSNPDINKYIANDLEAARKGIIVLMDCTEDETEKQRLKERLEEYN